MKYVLVKLMDNQALGLYKAGIVRRYVAVVVDSLIFIPVQVVIYIIIFAVSGSSPQSSSQADLLGALLRLGLLMFLQPLIFLAYNIFFTWKYGATLGKKWLKVKVISVSGQPLTLGQVIIRETIGKFLSGLVINLGYLWAIWDKNRQTWHDKLGKTYVVTSVPNDVKNPWWYYLLLILPFISILAVLAAFVVLAINPSNLQRAAKDSVRLADLNNINIAIQIAQTQNPEIRLCGNEMASCDGSSLSADMANRKIDGTGWVKVDLSGAQGSNLSVLPIDPTNSGEFYYRYCSDGVSWELNAKLDSNESQLKMTSDQGDDPNLYEVGSNLNLCSAFMRVDLNQPFN